MQENFDMVVIGAGAAGLFCAGTAAQRGQRVLVLEHGPAPGRKILISGGGRCNFTNREVSAKNFLGANPHFCKSALAQFSPRDFLALVEAAGIPWHEKTLGQLFCDRTAQDILSLLLGRMEGAVLRCGVSVGEITHDGARFTIAASGALVRSKNLVVASGGLSIPKLGASNFAYELAKRFGHKVIPPRPALVPLLFAESWMPGLAGVAAPVQLRAGKAAFSEALLFTHRGLSGPAVLQISSYLAPGSGFTADFGPGQSLPEALIAAKAARPKAGLKSVLGELLPARLAAHFAGAGTQNMADLPDKFLRGLGERLNRFPLTPTGTEGFAKAEVTAGGVDTDGLQSRDCQSKTIPGLFFIGEAVDVTGWLGGYNFQWAWASGFAAGAGAAS